MPRECECCGAGGCGPEPIGLTRREFLGLVGAGTLMGGLSWEEWVSRQGSEADLAAWKAQLNIPSPPRKYRSDRHMDARMPLGGIGTGNFDLGVDGRFTTWQLFNTLRDGHVPFFFAVRAEQTAKLLQTSGGPDWPRVKGIEMTGEYPLATLAYDDPELPVKLEMTAFSPFSPLDTRLSSMPLACFVFRIHNPTDRAREVSLAAFIQNPVGYDAMGVPISFNSIGFNAVGEQVSNAHPNFGGNRNFVSRGNKITALIMDAVGEEPQIDQPLRVFTNLPVDRLNSPCNDRPKDFTVRPLDRLPAESEGAAEKTMIWLEDAPADLPAEHLRAARRAVERGARLVFAGKTQPLLDLYGRITEGKPLDSATLRPDVLFEDFENGYGEWKVEGTAFGTKPAAGTLPNQQAVSGFLGKGLVNTYLNGDDTTGSMTSRPFKVERNFIRFLVGGGRHERTQIRLVVDGKVVRAASGRDNERLLPASWDVRDLRGKTAHIQIVDEQQGGWGHINVDHIEFSDLPGSAEVMSLLQDLLPIRFAGVRPKTSETGRVEFAGRAPAGSGADDLMELGSAVWRKIGTGRVYVLDDQLLDAARAELIGARQAAYEELGRLADVRYTAPRGVPASAPGHGVLALAALGSDGSALGSFEDWDAAWAVFARDGRFEDTSSRRRPRRSERGRTVNGAVASTVQVGAGKTVEVPFLLAWRYPNKYNGAGQLMGNHYAETWKDVSAVIREASASFDKIWNRTERFRKVFSDSTLPNWLLDCLSSQLSTIRHVGVVFRIANGDVYGWEGSNGCCQPTCTHVWGYEQSLAYCFPDLERDMRRIDFTHQQRADGGINNRTEVPSPPRPTGEQPFADGHASCVLKAYREALNSPDDGFLREYYPRAKKAVEYLIGRDSATSNGEPNGVLEDDQWNTYDQILNGVTSFISGYYLAALRAGEEWARRMNDDASADRFRGIFEKGRKRLVDLCWNGEYFHQNLPGYERLPGTVGPGCMSDQLIGQWWAHQLGLGYILPEDIVRTALRSIYKYNWIPDLTNWPHSPRAFAGAKDKGLIICTWPKGGRPGHVMLYSDEVWTGIEYQVAAHMIYEGMTDEAFAIIKGARDRYDGIPRAPIPRNPWNEIECGGHYARAMSSWSILLALSGFRYDGPNRAVEFAPRHKPESFKSFFTAPSSWGTVQQVKSANGRTSRIQVHEGRLRVALLSLSRPAANSRPTVFVNGKARKAGARTEGDRLVIRLDSAVELKAGGTLEVRC